MRCAGIERVVPADVHRGVGAQRAGEHPHERHPAHVGVGRGAHDLGGQRPVEVGRERGRARSRRCPTRAAAGAPSGDGNPPISTSSSASSPIPLEAQTGITGWNVPRATAVSRSSISVVTLDVLALEVALHERLVLGLLDDPLDEGGAGVLGAVGRLPRGGLREQAVQAGHRLAVADRQVERGDAGAEALLAGRDRGLLVGPRVVAPGDDDRARHPDGGALLPLRDGGRVDQCPRGPRWRG